MWRTWLIYSSIAAVDTIYKVEWLCKVVSMDRMTHGCTHSDSKHGFLSKSHTMVGLGLI